MNYMIFVDGSADVDLQAVGEENIKFIPMEYSLAGEMRVCDTMQDRQTLKDFYNGQRRGDLTKTTQISPYMYEEFFSPYMEKGISVLYLALSSGLSSTYNSALMARENLKEKYPDAEFVPVDSLGGTGGIGVLAERALRNRQKGMTIAENRADLVNAAKKIKHWFLVQDLNYLKRGGRVSATTAFVGSALNIKPILKIGEDGKLITFAKKRGNNAAAAELVEKFKESYDESGEDVIYVVDADDRELGDTLKAEVLELYPNRTVRRCTLSPIIGAHTGPGMAAICYIGK